MRTIVFANGIMRENEGIIDFSKDADLIIAADGGAKHCITLGIRPNLVVGDLDSLSEEEINQFISEGVGIREYPREKDETDLEIALMTAAHGNPDEIIVFGGMGARWDMTLGNLLLLANHELQGQNIRFVDCEQEVYLVTPGHQMVLRGEPGDIVSLIPIKGDVHGIITEGLEYPLSGETLVFGETRGISNLMTSESATVKIQTGFLVCTVIHHQFTERSCL